MKSIGNGLPPHIVYDGERRELVLLDQRALPDVRHVRCRTCGEAARAIGEMVVRGAPAIGVAAAYACVLAAFDETSFEASLDALEKARPTAVNLAWAVARMREAAAGGGADLPGRLLAAARGLEADDIARCRAIGRAGAGLINDGDCVLTHCNAGALATGGYGTALGVIRAAAEAGRRVSVIADETRPFWQGARLTAYELAADGIPVRLACDNSCALLMRKGLVQLVVVGADRIAANGDTANKIGTLGVAIMARHFGIPFYIAAPLSTIDMDTADGGSIPIEQRPPDEVRTAFGRRLCPEGVEAYNFAFDVTPAGLIDGIVTEAGILRAPYGESIASAMRGA